MNRRRFLRDTAALTAAVSFSKLTFAEKAENRVAVLLIDTDRETREISRGIYGQFLEHINHSVEDGLFAELVRGAGFEGNDLETFWTSSGSGGQVTLVDSSFQNSLKAVRLQLGGGHASLHQKRIFLEQGVAYDGFLWLKREDGDPHLALNVRGDDGTVITTMKLGPIQGDWHRIVFRFESFVRDTNASIELIASGRGSLLVDFVSLARADVRKNGMLRPDLLQALKDLGPSFIRWPGGSFASTYQWKQGIGDYAARGYHPNVFWGGYSDYYGFGTDEFLNLCRKLDAKPLITLKAQNTSEEEIRYALEWVHYLNDPPTTEWGKRRAANGHTEPYGVTLFQIDNEPMNNGFTAESYAGIVNAFGPRLREAAPNAKIIACGQKRSNDMDWSETVIDLAGSNFDLLGCHNYEYEPENFATGLRRIHGYLEKLEDYIRTSKYPNIEVGVLEWSLQHTYDWRAGLHAAGRLMMYEELSPKLTMTCPALLMRNTTDDPKWTSAIYHDHVGWFPGGSYPVSKLFQEHYAERLLSSTMGSFRGAQNAEDLVNKISTAIPQGWKPDGLDCVATATLDWSRIVVKAVNYEDQETTLLLQLKGAHAPSFARVTVHSITAKETDVASMTSPALFRVETKALDYSRLLDVGLPQYSVLVIEVVSEHR